LSSTNETEDEMILISRKGTGARALLAATILIMVVGGGRPALCEEDSAGEYAFIITSDYYTTGYYSTVEIPPPRGTTVSISPVSPDAVAYYDWAEDMIFVVNRYLADNVQIVESCPPFATIGQYSVGNGSNPHDMRLVDGTKAYVSRYEWKTLLICDPYTGDSLGTIDLGSLADSDGIPDMDRMEIADGRLFVTLNSIDRVTWQPDGLGKIAVIDVEADTLVDCDPNSAGVQPIILDLPNPYTELRYDRCRDELYVGCAGWWGITDGGVETIDPHSLQTKGVMITEEDLGGDVWDVVLAPGGVGYAVVLDSTPWPENFARLVKFDAQTATVTDTLFRQTSGTGSALAGIEINRQMELYLSDRNVTHPGIRIYDIGTDTQVAFVNVGLPPFDIVFTQRVMASVAGRDLDHQSGDASCISAHPNPFRCSTRITYCVPDREAVGTHLAIFDITGRRVRMLAGRAMAADAYSAEWDGRDDLGTPVAPGLYFCRLEGSGDHTQGKVLLLR
jgi:hypothetical protein